MLNMQLINNIFQHIFVFIIINCGGLNIRMINKSFNCCNINTIG